MNTHSFFSKQAVAATVGAAMLGVSFAQTPSDKPVVSGSFIGDGKAAKIKHVLAVTHDPFSDKAAIQIIFTEKDAASSKHPKIDAGFKKMGSALLLSVFKDGDIFGCEVAHTAHPKSPFSALGGLRKIENFKVTDTHVSGHVITEKEQEAFGQTWTVDLTFSAPLPKGAFADAAPEKADDSKKMTAKSKSKSSDEAEAASGPKPDVAQLPLPAGAKDVEYKAIVQQITLNADGSVSTVAKDFSAKLKAQGWKESPGSLMGKSNAILKRKLNGAELTAMVQPAGKGSTVKIFTQGFDWSNPPESSPAAKPAKSDADGIEAEANRLIKDALKGIPGLK